MGFKTHKKKQKKKEIYVRDNKVSVSKGKKQNGYSQNTKKRGNLNHSSNPIELFNS
jgi:hypothetical protein